MYGDNMLKILNERGYDAMGGGQPNLLTKKAKKSRQTFEDRLERVIRAAKGKTTK